jgi:predicted nucleotide-binding protein (sugar kinase/HSP70/actin superfamily)
MVKVGVPRALSYYRYFPMWKTMLEGMGAQVVVSEPTGRVLLEEGVRHCLDDICVPVKLFFGHALSLKDKADAIFVSRVVSVEKGDSDTYTCPKLIGLPDMVKGSLDGLPPMLEFVMDVQNRSLKASVKSLAATLGVPPSSAKNAFESSLEVQARYESELLRGLAPGAAMSKVLPDGNGSRGSEEARDTSFHRDPLSIALVGHDYLVHDSFISHDLPSRLNKLGAKAVLMSEVPDSVIEKETARYPEISWSYEKELLGAASHFLGRPDIDGVMMVIGFACGPDSIIAEIIAREVRRPESPPLTTLVLDEHTGQAGVATRVEAFVELIRRSRNKR